MLAPKQSLDLLDGLDMDFLKVGYSGDIGQARSFSLGEDYFLDQAFDGDDGNERTRLDSISEHDLDNIFRHRNSCASSGGALTDGDGSFDLVGGNFFDGLGGYFALPASSRRHSLCLSPGLSTPRSGFISGMGTSGDVDLSAYESMAASLQAQSLALGQRQVTTSIRRGRDHLDQKTLLLWLNLTHSLLFSHSATQQGGYPPTRQPK